MVAKDNHVPCIEKPMDQSVFFPKNENNNNNLESWKNNNSANNRLYTPGYPEGSVYPGVACNK
jgi:hypothetical protein